MNFIITKVSDWAYRENREINTLEDMLAICEEFGSEIIITPNGYNIDTHRYDTPTIEIYDDYRE